MSKPDDLSRAAIPEYLMLSRLAQSEQMREFFIQMWLQNPALAKQGGSKVQNLLSPLTLSSAEKIGSGLNFPKEVMDKTQRGFSLVSAIFLLVVIAALGTFAVTLSTTQQQSAALDVMGARAYQAARAGIEWGAFEVLQNSGVGINCATPLPASAATTVTMPGSTTLQGFQVTVYCGNSAVSEASATVTMYQLTSTASTVVATGSVERQMSVTIAN